MSASARAREEAAIAALRSLVVDGCVRPGSQVNSCLPVGDLDDKSRALVGVAAVIATGGGPCAYRRCVDIAIAAGASDGEMVDVLFTVARTIGLCRLASATSELAAALGYDIDRALESFDPPHERHAWPGV